MSTPTPAPAAPSPVYARLGANMRRLRAHTVITPADLADATERYSAGAIAAAEAEGRPLPELDLGALARVAALLDCDPVDLLAAPPPA